MFNASDQVHPGTVPCLPNFADLASVSPPHRLSWTSATPRNTEADSRAAGHAGQGNQRFGAGRHRLEYGQQPRSRRPHRPRQQNRCNRQGLPCASRAVPFTFTVSCDLVTKRPCCHWLCCLTISSVVCCTRWRTILITGPSSRKGNGGPGPGRCPFQSRLQRAGAHRRLVTEQCLFAQTRARLTAPVTQNVAELVRQHQRRLCAMTCVCPWKHASNLCAYLQSFPVIGRSWMRCGVCHQRRRCGP